MSNNLSIPIDILDDPYLLYEPPSEEEFIKILQGEIDSLGFELFIRDQTITELKDQLARQNRLLLALAHVSEWEL